MAERVTAFPLSKRQSSKAVPLKCSWTVLSWLFRSRREGKKLRIIRLGTFMGIICATKDFAGRAALASAGLAIDGEVFCLKFPSTVIIRSGDGE